MAEGPRYSRDTAIRGEGRAAPAPGVTWPGGRAGQRGGQLHTWGAGAVPAAHRGSAVGAEFRMKARADCDTDIVSTSCRQCLGFRVYEDHVISAVLALVEA